MPMDSKGPSLAASTSLDATGIEDDPLVDGPLISPDALHSAIRREFQSIPTPCTAILLSMLHVVYVALAVALGVVCMLETGSEDECLRLLGTAQGDSVMVLGKVGVWLLVLLFNVCVQHHHSSARNRGYLRFYRDTRGLKHLPLTVHSSGNVAVLVALCLDLQPSVRVYVLLSILGLELLVSLPCLIIYTVRVMQFNRERASPDISQEEQSHPHSHISLSTETGFREGSSLEEVVEKQADLIEYLRQHNILLSKRLLNLTAQH